MKKLSTLIVLLVAVMLLFNCSKDGSASETGVVFDPDKEYTLTMGTFGDLGESYKNTFSTDHFKETYPNVTVEPNNSDYGSHHNRLTTVIAAGDATNDIEAVEIGFISKFVEAGGLLDMSKEPYNGLEEGKDIAPFAMSNSTTVDGKFVAFPVDIAPAVIFYRKDITDEYGIDVESFESWYDYIDAGKKVTDPDKVLDDSHTGQFWTPNPDNIARMPLNGGKGDWVSENGEPLKPKDKFIQSLEVVDAIRTAGIDGQMGDWSGPWTESFATGGSVTYVSGAWFGGALKNWIAPDLAGKWRVASLPGEGLSSMGGSYLCIPETVPDEKKGAAYEIVKYLCTSEEAQMEALKFMEAFPALTTVYDDPMFDEPIEYFGGQKARQLYAEIAETIPEARVTPNDNAILSVFNNAINSVKAQEMEPEEAYEEAVKEVQAVVQ